MNFALGNNVSRETISRLIFIEAISKSGFLFKIRLRSESAPDKQGGREVQPGRIREYWQDLNRAPNTEFGLIRHRFTAMPDKKTFLRWLLINPFDERVDNREV